MGADWARRGGADGRRALIGPALSPHGEGPAAGRGRCRCGAGPAMEEPGCGAQFRAAVQVIQGLPRSGAYRPSYEEMLRFYSYYKQATAGCCQDPRPGFWDPIGRYKWDAWHSLGRMSKEEAMAAYVAEMKKVAQKVIDTVPMDESTEEMFRYFEPLYEVIHDMPRPPESFFKRKGESQGRPDGPSQDIPASSLALESPRDTVPGEQQDRQHVPGAGLAPAPEALEGSQVTSDSEGDMFCDTLEQMEPEKAGQVRGLTPNVVQVGAEPPVPHSAVQDDWGEGRRPEGSSSTELTALGSETGCLTLAMNLSRGRSGRVGLSPGAGNVWLAGEDPGSIPELAPGLAAELEAHVASTVRALQEELRRVRERLSRLETLGAAQGDVAGTDPGPALVPQAMSPWHLTVSPRTLLFLATWPFVTQWLLRHWQGRRR